MADERVELIVSVMSTVPLGLQPLVQGTSVKLDGRTLYLEKGHRRFT